MKLHDRCPYEFPCLMIGKKGQPWAGSVFIMAVNEVDNKHSNFINAILVKPYDEVSQIGDNYGFDCAAIMNSFEPYHGQVIIHSEELSLNFNLG